MFITFNNSVKPSKTELASCSTVFIFKVLTSQEEILLGNPRDFNAFHRSLGLPIDLLNFFSKNYLFIRKKCFSYFMSCCIINIFVNV